MKSPGELWKLWLVGAGIGLVYGLFAAIGHFISSRRKKRHKEPETKK